MNGLKPHMISSLTTPNNGHANGNGHGAAQLRIIVTKCNPSRGRGYEVAHFVTRGQKVKSLSERDVFLPSLTKAANWVLQQYPSATMERGCNDRTGHLAALCFRCGLADIALRESKN